MKTCIDLYVYYLAELYKVRARFGVAGALAKAVTACQTSRRISAM
jgi:hypothetical protein